MKVIFEQGDPPTLELILSSIRVGLRHNFTPTEILLTPSEYCELKKHSAGLFNITRTGTKLLDLPVRIEEE